MFKPLSLNVGRKVTFNWKKYWYCRRNYPFASVLRKIEVYRILLTGQLEVTSCKPSRNGYSLIKVKNLTFKRPLDIELANTWFWPVKSTEQFINLSQYI